MKPNVGRAVDNAHPAVGDQTDHTVRADIRAGQQRVRLVRELSRGEDERRRFQKSLRRRTGGDEIIGIRHRSGCVSVS